ncbi:hypothetical protein F4703DRAFT_1790520 [Phycomyces blakesleeanus]
MESNLQLLALSLSFLRASWILIECALILLVDVRSVYNSSQNALPKLITKHVVPSWSRKQQEINAVNPKYIYYSRSLYIYAHNIIFYTSYIYLQAPDTLSDTHCLPTCMLR